MSSDIRYFNLMELIPSLRAVPLNKLEEKLTSPGHPVLPKLVNYSCGADLDDLFIYMFHDGQLLVHIAAVKGVCRVLGVEYPERHVRDRLPVIEEHCRSEGSKISKLRAVLSGEADRAMKIESHRRRILRIMEVTARTEDKDRLVMLNAILTMESHFAMIKVRAAADLPIHTAVLPP